MGRPAVGECLPVALDRVLVTEACALDVDAARVDLQAIVEPRRLQVADVRLEHERLDAEVAQTLVTAGVALEVLDARHLEPHEVVRVVRDTLRIRLGEADAYVR